MKITSANLMRWAGACALIGGLCYVFVGVFHPANVPASVVTTRWQIVHVVVCVMPFFGLLGLVGNYVRQAVKAGWIRPGWLRLPESVDRAIEGFSFVEAFILPHLATASPALVEPG